MSKASKQRGFGAIEIIVAVVLLVVIGFVAWRVLIPAANQTNQETNSSESAETRSGYVDWSFNGNSWSASGAPKCENPLAIASPVDIGKVNSVLMPGEIRGGDFKPHGGLAGPSNSIEVYAVRDAYLYRGSQYIQPDGNVQEVQYMFDFIDPCGIMYRFDHLATLTDEFKAYADRLPEPQLNDSRTYHFDDRPFVAKGTVIATEIGIKGTGNAGFDIGVYDLRQQNEASKTDLYKTDSLRISDKEQSFYALCWFGLLPSVEREIVLNLPLRNGEPQSGSDYCN